VAKPLSGALDVASNTAEGIKNTAGFMDNSRTHIRFRDPRAIYAPNSSIKPYNEFDAKVLGFLSGIKKGKVVNKQFLAQSVNYDFRQDRVMCVVFLDKIVLANISKK